MAFPLDKLSTTPQPGTFIGGRANLISKKRDFEDGGIALTDASAGLLYQQWRCRLIGTQVLLDAPNKSIPEILIDESGIEEISFSFDQNMRYCLAFMQNGIAKFRWFDATLERYDTIILPEGTITPRVSLDDKRASQLSKSDIILAYVRNNNLYFRKQRDRFLIEYLLKSNINYGLSKIGMSDIYRLQFELDLLTPYPIGDVFQSQELLPNKSYVGFIEYNPDTSEILSYYRWSDNPSIEDARKIYRISTIDGSVIGTIGPAILKPDYGRSVYNPIKHHMYFWGREGSQRSLIVVNTMTNLISNEIFDLAVPTALYQGRLICVNTDTGYIYQLYQLYQDNVYVKYIREINSDTMTVVSTTVLDIDNNDYIQDFVYADGKVWILCRNNTTISPVYIYEFNPTNFSERVSKSLQFDTVNNYNYSGICYDNDTNTIWMNYVYDIFSYNLTTKTSGIHIDVNLSPITGIAYNSAIDTWTLRYEPVDGHIWTWGYDDLNNQYAIAYETLTGDRCAVIPITQSDNPEYEFYGAEGLTVGADGYVYYTDGGIFGLLQKVKAKC